MLDENCEKWNDLAKALSYDLPTWRININLCAPTQYVRERKTVIKRCGVYFFASSVFANMIASLLLSERLSKMRFVLVRKNALTKERTHSSPCTSWLSTRYRIFFRAKFKTFVTRLTVLCLKISLGAHSGLGVNVLQVAVYTRWSNLLHVQ